MPETVACNLCQASDPEPQLEIGAFLGVPDPFTLVRCGRCGLFFLSPRATLEELGAMYANHPYYAADNAFRGETRQAFYDAKIKRLERFVPGRGRMLGIGCLEGGYALRVAQDRGWEVSGIEFSPILTEHVRAHLGVPVECVAGWDLGDEPSSSFDAVYTHSFEHLPDPRTTLRACRRLLRPGGHMMLEVPHEIGSLKQQIKRLALRLCGERVKRHFVSNVGPEFHLYYLDPDTLTALVRSEGFEVVELRTYLRGHPVYYGSPGLQWLREFIYATGAVVKRGPCIEVIARTASSSGGAPRIVR